LAINMVNPFDFSRPVRDPAMFLGRRDIRTEVLEGVRQGASFALIGGTRIGKTSLLFQVRHVLLEQLKGQQNAVIGPVFLSTHEFPRLSQAVIYRRIVEEFRTTLAIPGSADEWRNGVRLFEPTLSEDEAFDAFRQALETVFQSREVDRRIVIMIDEVDELSRYEWSHSFFNNLRHLISQTTAGERIAIVIAGTLAIRSLYEVAGSPFLNVIQGTKTLDLLSRSETEELVGRPTGYRLDTSVVSAIFFETGGHPFLVQYLMKYLCLQFGEDLSRATEKDLLSVVERYFDERTDFDTWVSDFADAERQAYHLIASTAQGATRSELVKAIGDPKQVNHAIKMLVHIGVVREERPNSNRYLVGGDMFRRWFYDTFDANRPVQPPVVDSKVKEASRKPDSTLRLVKVFVSSPGDGKEERDALDAVVAELNKNAGRQAGMMLDLIKWETDSHPGVALGGPQAVIDPQIAVEDCDVVLGIFWHRFGTPTAFGNSGSSHEIERACESALRRRKPKVMVYFSERPSAPKTLDEIDQWRKVVEFRERLGKLGLYFTYDSVQTFADLARKHLDSVIGELALSLKTDYGGG
jgi:hypothetical protein